MRAINKLDGYKSMRLVARDHSEPCVQTGLLWGLHPNAFRAIMTLDEDAPLQIDGSLSRAQARVLAGLTRLPAPTSCSAAFSGSSEPFCRRLVSVSPRTFRSSSAR